MVDVVVVVVVVDDDDDDENCARSEALRLCSL